MDLKKELDLCVRSRFPLICIVSHEEERIVETAKALCAERACTLYAWDHADYFQALNGDQSGVPTAKDPLTALETVDRTSGQVVFVLRDFHQCWDKQPRIVRKLRNLAQRLKYTKKTVIVTTPVDCIPEELKDDFVLLDFPAPVYGDLVAILKRLLEVPNVKSAIDNDAADRIVRSALGLSSNQAQRVFAKAIVSNGQLDERDIELITAEKQQIIRESGALEYFTPNGTLTDVGGLEELKGWLRMRERAFGPAARRYGLPEPKGIALIGVPGTGKSLTAKMVSSLWRLPLIRLDIGAVFGEFVGMSEQNVRKALRLAETVSPCVLWIDEIEKSLSSGAGDGGTSQRVFATLLSWMQEKEKPVFVVATANDVSRLPPELLRRGRFDEIFFLDLPTDVERREILVVHLRKRGRDPGRFDLERLSADTDAYVGAEIEQAIIDAMFIAFNDPRSPEREFTDDDVVAALTRLVPMSHSQRENIAALRSWLTEGRAQSASSIEKTEATVDFVPIEVEP
jgi:SpoVK/Ycf46/Vps4 family AAA+-type ATPase